MCWNDGTSECSAQYGVFVNSFVLPRQKFIDGETAVWKRKALRDWLQLSTTVYVCHRDLIPRLPSLLKLNLFFLSLSLFENESNYCLMLIK